MDIGILIIGSLYWDDQDARREWRRLRLRVAEENSDFLVEARIRYGRRSRSRNDTYTMVYSPSAAPGQARAVRCQRAAESIDNLIEEARHLWKAEDSRSDVGRISASWGCVGLLVNPDSQIPPAILAAWSQFIQRQTVYGGSPTTQAERTLVDAKGLLHLPWPQLAGPNRSPAPLDLLLATATHPTLGGDPLGYPSVLQIARAWGEDEEDAVDYFKLNRKHGIVTFEDELILGELRKSFPTKATDIA